MNARNVLPIEKTARLVARALGCAPDELAEGLRPARADELQGATEHLRDQERALSEYYRSHAPPKGVVVNPREEALASLAQVLCSSNAFLYIE